MTHPATHPAGLALPAPSPELVQLIAEHDRVTARLDALDGETGSNDELVHAAGAMRARLAAFRSRVLPDVLAKAACLARVYPPEGIEAEIRPALGGHAYLDEVWVSLAVELMKAAEGKLAA